MAGLDRFVFESVFRHSLGLPHGHNFRFRISDTALRVLSSSFKVEIVTYELVRQGGGFNVSGDGFAERVESLVNYCDVISVF